jgi:hypothetical protein
VDVAGNVYVSDNNLVTKPCPFVLGFHSGLRPRGPRFHSDYLTIRLSLQAASLCLSPTLWIDGIWEEVRKPSIKPAYCSMPSATASSVAYLVEQKLADPKRIDIMGVSMAEHDI